MFYVQQKYSTANWITVYLLQPDWCSKVYADNNIDVLKSNIPDW